MEVTIISTFDVDLPKLLEFTKPPPNITIEESKQCIRDTLLMTFEASVREGFESNDFIRLVYSILQDDKT